MTDDKTFPTVEPPPHPGTLTNPTQQGENNFPQEPVDTSVSEGKDNSLSGQVYEQQEGGEAQAGDIAGTRVPDAYQAENKDYSQEMESSLEAASQDSPFNVLQPQPVEGPNPTQTAQTQQSGSQETSLPPPPKKRFPKTLILIVIIFLILGGLIALALRLRPDRLEGLIGTKGEITWWGVSLEENTVKSLIDEYEKKNPNIKVNYVKQSSNDYRERLTNALASGEGPDVFEIHNSWVPMFRTDLAPMPASVMSQDEFSKTFYPVIVSDLGTQGGVVGMPLEYDAITLFINEDIFASAAKSAPKTWDEVRETALKLTQKDENGLVLQSGVGLGLTENIDHWQEILALMLLQNGVNLAKPEGTSAQDALSFFIQFSKVDGVWDASLPPSTIAFARNKVAMYFGPTRRALEITQLNPNLKFKTVPLPQLPKDKPTDPNVSYATYWVQSVWKKSKNSDISWEFLKYLSSQETLQALNQERKESNLLERAYPRQDMAILHRDDKILGSIIAFAPEAKSWYLADETYDGPTGINSQINKIYEETIQTAIGREGIIEAVETLPGKIAEVLSKYGVVVR